jgi:hypothetical protein
VSDCRSVSGSCWAGNGAYSSDTFPSVPSAAMNLSPAACTAYVLVVVGLTPDIDNVEFALKVYRQPIALAGYSVAVGT